MKTRIMIWGIGLLTLYLLHPGFSIAQEAGSDVESILRGGAGLSSIFFLSVVLFLGALAWKKKDGMEKHIDENAGDEGDD